MGLARGREGVNGLTRTGELNPISEVGEGFLLFPGVPSVR